MVEGRKALSYLPDAGLGSLVSIWCYLKAAKLGIFVGRFALYGDPPRDYMLDCLWS